MQCCFLNKAFCTELRRQMEEDKAMLQYGTSKTEEKRVKSKITNKGMLVQKYILYLRVYITSKEKINQTLK